METKTKPEPGIKMMGTGFQKITPFLWFDNQAEQAVNFYTAIFAKSEGASKGSRIRTITRYGETAAKASGREEGSVMTIAFQIEGQEFVALNGGPAFEINPSISFFVNCATLEEIENLWEKLSKGGNVLMKLDRYPFNEKYGWVEDKFGVSWQLILQDRTQKIVPCLMFTGEQHKKAEEAINFYISVFKNSDILQIERYKGDQEPQDAIVHSKFVLNGQEFVAMDSHVENDFSFNPAISFVLNADSQEEIDYYWDKLSEGGDERAQQCGWLQDKYGVSWQIVPTGWDVLLHDAEPSKANKLMAAILQMKKFDLDVINKINEQMY